MTLKEKAQKIADSYKGCPPDPLIRESMINEVAHLIVDYLMSKQEDIETFDFKEFFENLEFPDYLI